MNTYFYDPSTSLWCLVLLFIIPNHVKYGLKQENHIYEKSDHALVKESDISTAELFFFSLSHREQGMLKREWSDCTLRIGSLLKILSSRYVRKTAAIQS